MQARPTPPPPMSTLEVHCPMPSEMIFFIDRWLTATQNIDFEIGGAGGEGEPSKGAGSDKARPLTKMKNVFLKVA